MPDDNPFSQVAESLSSQELQDIHTATYLIKSGTVKGNYNMGRVGQAWDAIQPVVARGGGAAKPSTESVAAQPVSTPPDTRTAFQKLYTPAPDTENKIEQFVSLGKIQSTSQYDAYLDNPAIAKTRGQAFAQGTNQAISKVAAQQMTPLGIAMAALPFGEAYTVGKAGKTLLMGADAARALESATTAEQVAQATARGKVALDATNRLRTAANVMKGASTVVTQAAGVQGDVSAYEAYKRGDYSGAAVGLAQSVLGHFSGAIDIARTGGFDTRASIVDAANAARTPKAPSVEVMGAAPKGASEVAPAPMPRGNQAPIDVTPTNVVEPTKPLVPSTAIVKKTVDIAAKSPDSTPVSTPDSVRPPATQIQEPPKSAAEIISQIGSKLENKQRPRDLADADLKTIAALPQKDAIVQGLARDDHMAAVAEAKRRGLVEGAVSEKPQEDIHTAISRISRASDAEDFSRRKSEFQQHLSTILKSPSEIQESTAGALEQRASTSQQYAANIERVLAAKDFAGEVKALRSQNKQENPGMSHTTDPESGVIVSSYNKRGAYQPSTESQYLDAVAGRGSVSLVPMRDKETGKVVTQPQVSPEQAQERNEFVKNSLGELKSHIDEVRAAGGVPSAEQRAKGVALVDAIQAGSGMRFSFEGSSSKVDPDQATWNQWMGRTASTHLAKPTPEAAQKRLSQLKLEGDLANLAAVKIRSGLPKKLPETAGQAEVIGPEDHAAIAASQIAKPVKPLPSYITEARGRWFSTDESVARRYGGQIKAVDVPPEVAKQTDYASLPGKPERVLPQAWATKAQALEGMGVVPEGHVRLFRGESEPLKSTPSVNAFEGKSDDLHQLFQAADDIPKPLMSAVSKLHSITSEEDRDYLAHALLNSAGGPKLATGEMAKRYASALNQLREDTKKGINPPSALARAANYAATGRRPGAAMAKGEAGYISPVFIPEILNELNKHPTNAPSKTVDAVRWMSDFLQKGTWKNVSPEFKVALYKYRARMYKQEDLGRIGFNAGIEAIRAMPIQQQISTFVDAAHGRPMPSADLQSQRDMLQQQEDRGWVHLHESGVNVDYWQDYIAMKWSKPPKHAAALFERQAQAINRGVLSGDKGFLRKRQYEDIVEGMKDGGVPASTNLFEMGLLGAVRREQLLGYRELMEFQKSQGTLVRGAAASESLREPTRVDANIVSSFFPVETKDGKTVMTPGEPWYMEKGEHEVLKKYLSHDYIRENVVGRAFMGLKNLSTAAELFSPFHAWSMVYKGISQARAQGMNRMLNVGVAHGDMLEAVKGLGEVIDSLRMPYKNYKEGKALMEAGGQMMTGYERYGYSKQAYLESPGARRLTKIYGPHVEEYIDALLEGGMRVGVDPKYETKYMTATKDALSKNEYAKALLNVIPGVFEKGMSPLFKYYIPALKVGAGIREIAVEQKRNAGMIASGEVLAGDVNIRAVRRVEDNLGMMNWDHFNMSKTVKSILQFLFTSPTWRAGTVNIAVNAAVDTLKEPTAALAYGRMPNVPPDALLVANNYLTNALTAMALAAVGMGLFAKKQPTTMNDFMRPDTGEKDSKGRPIRVKMPTYTEDFNQIYGEPWNYATGGGSGVRTRLLESMENRDFFGQPISNKKEIASWPERALHVLTPPNFAIQGASRFQKEGMPEGKATALTLLGFNPTRADVDASPAEKVLNNSDRRITFNQDAKTRARNDVVRKIAGSVASNRNADANKLMTAALRDGTLTFDQAEKALESAHIPHFQRLAESVAKNGNPKDIVEAYKVASASERAILKPIIYQIVLAKPELNSAFKEANKTVANKP